MLGKKRGVAKTPRKHKVKKKLEHLVQSMNQIWLDFSDMKQSLFTLSQDIKEIKDAIEGEENEL